MSTLSVAIIVKNEEHVIERCLTFVSKMADEIILVDTGSTDRTKELAEKFPKCFVFDSEFFTKDTHYSDFEFGKAKNEAIRRCTRDWVCILPGHRIFAEGGMIPIEQVSKGTKVLSHSGQFRDVTGTGVRDYSGPVVKIFARGNGESLELTTDHRVKAIRAYRCHLKEGTPCLPNCRKQWKKKSNGTKTPNCKKPYMSYKTEWIPAGELHEGDIALFPVPRRSPTRMTFDCPAVKKQKFAINSKPYDHDLGRFLGLYLAEGCIGSNHVIDFAFNSSEKEYHAFVESYLENLGLKHDTETKGNSTVVSAASVCLSSKLKSLVGCGSRCKHIPQEFFNAPKEFMLGLIQGLYDGDGTERQDGVQIKSVGFDVIMGMRAILAIMGIESSYQISHNQHGEVYVLNITGAAIDSLKAMGFSCSTSKPSKRYQLSYVDEEFIYMPIKKIERRQYEGPVYNLEVDVDKSYVCSGMIVHNCWMDADDFMDDENIAKLKKLIDTETRTCLYSFEITYGTLCFEHCRLFKNGASILFDEGHACHEYLNTRGNPLVIHRDIKIQHLPEHKGIPSSKRNIAIMEKDYYVRKRDDQRTLFYLANGYREDGQHDKAIDFYDKYLAKSEWREERYFARFYKAQCLFNQGKVDESRDEICKAMAEDFRFAESYCFLGDYFLHKKAYDTAILWYKMALNTQFPKDSRLFVSENSYSKYPTLRIGECMAKAGSGKDAPTDKETPPAIQKSEPTQPEASNRRLEKFSLPSDRGLAMMAISALSSCVNMALVNIEIITEDPWQIELVSRFDNLKIGRGVSKALSLPLNLKGKHAVEWYIRSAGFMFPAQFPVRVANSVKRDKSLVVITENLILPSKIETMIRQAGKEIRVVKDDEEMQPALLSFKDATAFIGHATWHYVVAEWTRVPAFVFYNGRDAKEYGWEDQENRSIGDFSGIENFLERSLAQ